VSSTQSVLILQPCITHAGVDYYFQASATRAWSANFRKWQQLVGFASDDGHASDDDISREMTRTTPSLRVTSPQAQAVKPYYSFARLRRLLQPPHRLCSSDVALNYRREVLTVLKED